MAWLVIYERMPKGYNQVAELHTAMLHIRREAGTAGQVVVDKLGGRP